MVPWVGAWLTPPPPPPTCSAFCGGPKLHPAAKKPPGVKLLRALFDEKMGCASEVYGSTIDNETAVLSGLHPIMAPSSITLSHCPFILFLCRCNIVLPLPLEVWDVIADLVHSDVLSQVCQKLRELIGTHRYVKLRCTGENVQRVLGLIGNVRSLQLDHGANSVGDSGAQALAALKDAPSLHTLCLDLGQNSVGESGAQALVALTDAASLHSLCLNLWWNSVGESGAQALAALKDAASLHTLSLDLCGNSVGESGAQALAALKDAPSLHTLSLSLGQNSVGDSGAQGLAALKDAASLHSLCLNLWWNSVGESGA